MMAEKNELAEETESDCAVYLKALGDPLRLKIVRTLTMGPLSVSDISLLLDLHIGMVSHHLRTLHHAGIVRTEREGKYIYYSISPEIYKSRSAKSILDFGCCKLDLRS